MIAGYDGEQWYIIEAGTTGHHVSVWGSLQSEIFIICEDGILHYTGTEELSKMPIERMATAGIDTTTKGS